MKPYEVIAPRAADHAVRVKKTFADEEEFWVLLVSDAHWDSPECQLWLLKEHLELARERGAMVIDNGDFLDVISSRWDRRGGHGGARKEHAQHDYLDSIIDSAAKWLAPYGDLFGVWGTGNHEAKVTKIVGTDLTRRLVDKLSEGRDQPIVRAGYEFWVRFQFTNKAGCSKTYSVKFSHGFGGSSPVTKGTINAQRMAADIDGADAIVTGHIHQKWSLPGVVETLESNTGRVVLKERHHIQLGSYKLDFRTDGAPTWHMQGNRQPKPLGGAWLRFTPTSRGATMTVEPTTVDYSRLKVLS